MSMHYIFRSEESVRCFLRIVAARLVPGGYFIGTVPDANVLVRKVRATKTATDAQGKTRMFTFGNSFYSAVLPQKRFPKDNAYGIKYYFYLEDSVGRKEGDKIVYVPEYLVIFEKFKELADEYGLELVERKNFHEFYSDNIKNPRHRKVFFKMVHAKESDTDKELKEQWDAIYVYMVFAFRKKGEPLKQTCGSCGSTEHLTEINAKGWD
eukprot:TRINITY_DN508_c0_g1_i3.p2 TRINITY_DN508_c0_g1~~TRINITY_DN508_c0_g1_i3.p2  ORF type:complete len:209 (+),score=93.49 TRINITY_DN508_c0_g1_i3:248-874(+)